MVIKGLQKLTLLDFPGHVAATVFFGGCDLRCPFCHNSSLVTEPDNIEDISYQTFFDFLEKRRGMLDGVAVTGGEPLMNPEIKDFLLEIKKRGYSVKLDTNGTFPDRLADIITSGAVDYIAMDIKNSPEKYSITCGISFDIMPKIRKSIALIMESKIPYEFRTTLVRGFHTEKDIAAIGEMICGANKYFLQTFVDSGDLIDMPQQTDESPYAFSRKETEQMVAEARKWVKNAEARGI